MKEITEAIEKIKAIKVEDEDTMKALVAVETINQRRDNNTPQNASNPDADTHLSFYSKNVNSTDLATIMARIREIKDNIYDEAKDEITEIVNKTKGESDEGDNGSHRED